MNKRNLALILVLVGFIIFFWPIVSQLGDNSSQLTGALFAVGGVILWFLPANPPASKKK